MVEGAPRGFAAALEALLVRIAAELRTLPARQLPIRMILAGGAALHVHTQARVTEDVDAVFSRRLILSDRMEVGYQDTDGRTRLLYLDRNYNDTLGLMHEDAHDDATPFAVPGVNRRVLDVRVLTPIDLAVSKLARFGDQDREDIELLAKRGLVTSSALRERAEQAMQGYVGRLESIRLSLDLVCRVVDAASRVRGRRR